MNDDFRNQVFNNLSLKETDELVEIWQTNDHTQWSDTAFDVIRGILQGRLGTIPQQDEPIYEHSEPGIDYDFEDKRNNIAELSEINDIEGLVGYLENDPDPMICLEAAMALSQLRDERGVDYLLAASQNPDEDIRSAAEEILGELGYLRDGNISQDQLLEVSDDNAREGRLEQISAYREEDFLCKLFMLRLRTRDAFYLVMLFVLGVIPFVFLMIPIVVVLLEVFSRGDSSNLIVLAMPSVFAVVTGVMTINFVLSLLEIGKIIPPLNSETRKK
jgi:hypothetical protein